MICRMRFALALSLVLVIGCDEQSAPGLCEDTPTMDENGDPIPLYSQWPGDYCTRDADCVGADESPGMVSNGGFCITFKNVCAMPCVGSGECPEGTTNPDAKCQPVLGRGLCTR